MKEPKQPTRNDILRYLEKRRAKPQYRHAPSAGWSTGKVVRPLARKFGPGAKALKSQWPAIVGEKWAALSAPMHVRGHKGAKTLTIIAKGPAAALINANSAKVLEQVNLFLGKDAVQKVKVRQGLSIDAPAAAKKLQKPMDIHTPRTLSEALDAFGEKVSKS